MVDLTDGTSHIMLQIRGDSLVRWDSLTPTQAYYKQAEFLKSFEFPLSRNDGVRASDLPPEVQRLNKKLRATLRPDCLIAEQLGSILPGLGTMDQIHTAQQFVHPYGSF